MKLSRRSLLAALCTIAPLSAQAQQAIRIGLILPMSGPFADYGAQISRGVQLFSRTGRIRANNLPGCQAMQCAQAEGSAKRHHDKQ